MGDNLIDEISLCTHTLHDDTENRDLSQLRTILVSIELPHENIQPVDFAQIIVDLRLHVIEYRQTFIELSHSFHERGEEKKYD